MSEERVGAPIGQSRVGKDTSPERPAARRRSPARRAARALLVVLCAAGLALTVASCYETHMEEVSSPNDKPVENTDIDANENGLATITWEAGDEVFAQHFDYRSGPVGDPVQVSPEGAAGHSPVVGVDATGDAVISYEQLVDDTTEIVLRRFESDGALGDPIVVSGPRAAVADSPAIAVDDKGYATVTWLEHGGVSKDGVPLGDRVRVQRITPANEVTEYAELLDAGIQTPKIEVDPKGAATLAWSDGFRIRTAQVPEGAAPPINQDIELDMFGTDPQLAVGKDGTASVVSSIDEVVLFRQIDPEGKEWPTSEALRLGDPGPDLEPTVTAANDSGEALVTWINEREVDGDIYDVVRAARVEKQADGVKAAFDLSKLSLASTAALSETSVASDGTGRAAIVWRRETGAGTHVLEARALLADDTLEPADGPADITNPNDPAARPVILAGPDGTVTGLWLGGSGTLWTARFIPVAECSDGTVNVPHNTTVEVPLSCTGVVDELRVTSGPANGTLGAIDVADGTVPYTPNPGYFGDDALSFEAENESGTSEPATVTLRVAAPSPGPPSGPTAQTAVSPQPQPGAAVPPTEAIPAGPVPRAGARAAVARVVSRRADVVVGRRAGIRRPVALTGRAARGLGIARVRVRCTGSSGAVCRGRVTLQAGRARLGGRAFSIRAGRTGAVNVRLTRATVRRLAARGRLRVSARATTRRTAGTASRATRRTLVLRAVRR